MDKLFPCVWQFISSRISYSPLSGRLCRHGIIDSCFPAGHARHSLIILRRLAVHAVMAFLFSKLPAAFGSGRIRMLGANLTRAVACVMLAALGSGWSWPSTTLALCELQQGSSERLSMLYRQMWLCMQLCLGLGNL